MSFRSCPQYASTRRGGRTLPIERFLSRRHRPDDTFSPRTAHLPGPDADGPRVAQIASQEFSEMAITQLQSRDLKILCLGDSIVERYEDSERRGHMRLGGDDVRWLRSARLKCGPDVRVLDISAGGILVETDGQLRPDANIVFELSGPKDLILVPSKVLRCRVASLGDVMSYHGACSFKRALEIPELLKQAMTTGTATTAPAAAPQPGAS